MQLFLSLSLILSVCTKECVVIHFYGDSDGFTVVIGTVGIDDTSISLSQHFSSCYA